MALRRPGHGLRPQSHGMTLTGWAELRLPCGIVLRPASGRDRGFAERLYLDTMRPLLQRLEAWDEDATLAHFRAVYEPKQVRLIENQRVQVGYLQVAETEAALTILQIHLRAEARGRGIGHAIIGTLLVYAGKCGKDVLLSVVRHNRAITLYRRLGFAVVAEDALRLHMRWQPAREGHLEPPLPSDPTAGQFTESDW
jgi:GNAT superfamily N-acetyltransferase